MTFEILNITSTQITVNLTFESTILISQGELPDQVLVKLNKDLFLLPSRFATANTVKDPEEEPYYMLTE